MHENINGMENILKLMKNEKNFKLQILSIESYKTFIEILDLNKIEYTFSYFSDPIISKNINFIYQNQSINDFEFPILGKFILFGNSFHFDFIQFCFKLTDEFKENYIKKKYINEKFISSFVHLIPNYNLHELEIQLNPKESFITYNNYYDINYLENNILNKLEISLLFIIYNHSKLSDICLNLEILNSKYNNSFEILLTINKLIEHSFIKSNNNKYYISISKEFLFKLCKEIGYNL